MRALIMGGTEFISLHLVQSLLARRHEVAVFKAYNVMVDDIISQVGFVELIAEAMGKPVTLHYVDPGLIEAADRPGPLFGQNLVYDCHAVHTTHKLRTELGIRPRDTLASGLHHTWKWYQASGLLERPIDFTFEDQLLAKLGA